MTASAVYTGWVAHRRFGPVPHSFSYRVFMPLFDLDELPELLDSIPLWSARRPAPARFHSEDYLGGGSPGLSQRARQLVRERIGRQPTGPVRVLANPRYLGVGFNPVCFFFLHSADGRSIEAVIAEVTNTPWGERIAYVLDGRDGAPGSTITGTFEKEMHVSPFQPMNQRYEISVTRPGGRLGVAIRSFETDREVFAASMALRRVELTRGRMLRMLLGYPPMTIATLARIYWNAALLKARGAPYHPHPEVRSDDQVVRVSELPRGRRWDRVAHHDRLRDHGEAAGRGRASHPRGTSPRGRGGDGGSRR
jgi:uncharacterized protein